MAASVATYCPSRLVELSKSKSTQPKFARRWATLYLFVVSVSHVPMNVEYPAAVCFQGPARRPIAHLGARDESQVDAVGDPDGAVNPD